MTSEPLDKLAAMGLGGSAPQKDVRAGVHRVALGLGVIATIAVATYLLLAVLPETANVLANVFLFVTRLVTGK